MAFKQAKTNPNQYYSNTILKNSTSTSVVVEAVDLGINCQYLRVESLSSEDISARFGSTTATTDDFQFSTGQVITLQTGPLVRDVAFAVNSTSTGLGGVEVLGLGG